MGAIFTIGGCICMGMAFGPWVGAGVFLFLLAAAW
jgi:hypothetical protein